MSFAVVHLIGLIGLTGLLSGCSGAEHAASGNSSGSSPAGDEDLITDDVGLSQTDDESVGEVSVGEVVLGGSDSPNMIEYWYGDGLNFWSPSTSASLPTT